MAIDLNQEWTNADLSALMGSVADDRDWRLEVDKSGIAALRDKTVPTDTAYDQTRDDGGVDRVEQLLLNKS